ncbi:MAG TPA: FAD-dependent monooxygenase [Myxococcaceae bacterium]|nr:FAD-dependent monooxygenase [Myxococcaceae bacterium]
MTQSSSEEVPVVIVGGGPVGLALAATLGRYGVRSAVIEARETRTPRDESRAITVMPRGMEFLEWLGLDGRFKAVGSVRSVHEFRAEGRPVLELDFGRVDSAYQYSLQLPQHDTEELLERAALETGCVQLFRGCTATRFSTHNGFARCEFTIADKPQAIMATYGVACDGAKSAARKALGLEGDWHDYGTDSAVADFEMDCPSPPDRSFIDLNVRRPVGLFNFAPGRWRITYRLNAGEDRRALTSESAATDMLRLVAPGARVRRFLWASAFRLGQAQAKRYRSDRWILAGDAAHAMGPSAGAGMMLGLLGAWRLGWRLVRAMEGPATAASWLDDYERVQRYAADQTQSSNKLIFQNIAVTHRGLGAARTALLRAVGKSSAVTRRLTETEALLRQRLPVVGAPDRPQLPGYRLATSLGSWSVGDRLPATARGLAPARALRHSLIDLGRHPGASEDVLRHLGVPAGLVVSPQPVTEGRAYALVRPDQHVAAIWKERV